MMRVAWGSPFSSLLFMLLLLPLSSSSFAAVGAGEPEADSCPPPLVTREKRKTIVSTDSGTISGVDINDNYAGKYHLEFFTLEPQSLLLPLLLHTDMVFYVETGDGRGTCVSWVDEDKIYKLQVESGDIYRIGAGSVVYMRSPPAQTGEKLQVVAIFDTLESDFSPDACVGPYSNLSDLVRGFGEQVLGKGFKVSQEVVTGIKSTEKPAPIVPFPAKHGTGTGTGTDGPTTWKEWIFEALIGGGPPFGSGGGQPRKKKGKVQKFNLLKARPDVQNSNGRSIAVTDRVRALKGSVFGVFNVNLAKGSMTGPRWNPLSTDIAIVTHGQGIVQVVLPNSSPGEGKPSNSSSGDDGKPSNSTSGDDNKPSNSSSAEGACKCPTLTFKVGEGDVFFVPRYHAVAHMSFNNDSLIFVGFRTSSRKNSPQILAGRSSILHILDSEILALSLGIPNATLSQFSDSREDADILECTYCAEEEEKKIEAATGTQKKEEGEKKKEEEKPSRREKEEAGGQEAKKREAEEKRTQQEEKVTRQGGREEKRREEEERQRPSEEEEVCSRKGDRAGVDGSESFKLPRVWINRFWHAPLHICSENS